MATLGGNLGTRYGDRWTPARQLKGSAETFDASLWFTSTYRACWSRLVSGSFIGNVPVLLRSICSVILMDELDQLMTAKQDVVYNLFNWPTLTGAKLVVLAVANTMNLPERIMSGRVRSRLGVFLFSPFLGERADGRRLGMVRINFQPYTTTQLEQIVHARLGGSIEVLSKGAVKFAAMKVSSISGDARRVLDICRYVQSCLTTSPFTYPTSLYNGL
jgi:CDC6/ORC-like protein/ATPase family protein associated with various cellular activities (AAA)